MSDFLADFVPIGQFAKKVRKNIRTVLVNPADANAETVLRDVYTATRAIELQIQTLNVSTSRDIDAAFATFARDRSDAFFVSGGPLFVSRRTQLVLLAARHALPASYGSSEYAEIDGLMSYGTSLTDAYRLCWSHP
jgi:putative ABC transport system substrate-binding protein